MQDSTERNAPANLHDPPAIEPAPREAMASEHKSHLLKLLKVIQGWQPAWYFLVPARLHALKLPRMLSSIRPTLTIDLIERRLRSGQYATTAELVGEFKSIVINVEKKWRSELKGHHIIPEGRDMIAANKKLLSVVEAAILRLPDPRPTVSETGPGAATTSIESSISQEQISDLLSKITLAKRTCLYPHDSEQSIFDLDKLGRDTHWGRYKSFEEVYDALEEILDGSEKRNGPRHRITSLMSAMHKHVKNILEEATIEAELLELKEAME